jgi:hypothetical protein
MPWRSVAGRVPHTAAVALSGEALGVRVADYEAVPLAYL